MCTMANGLNVQIGCLCAGTGCGGHLVFSGLSITPIGYQGAAQHTYTMACDGHHAPGPCPERQQPQTVLFRSGPA